MLACICIYCKCSVYSPKLLTRRREFRRSGNKWVIFRVPYAAAHSIKHWVTVFFSSSSVSRILRVVSTTTAHLARAMCSRSPQHKMRLRHISVASTRSCFVFCDYYAAVVFCLRMRSAQRVPLNSGTGSIFIYTVNTYTQLQFRVV